MIDLWRKAFYAAVEATTIPPIRSKDPHDEYADRVMTRTMKTIGIPEKKWRMFAACLRGTAKARIKAAYEQFGDDL